MNFPPLKNDNLLRAARGEKVSRLPIWIMRQAGRHLQEYKEYTKVGSLSYTKSYFRMKDKEFFETCQTPEFACEVTMQPIRRYDMDASIIFSDILVIPQAMGMECKMVPGKGPTFTTPLTIDNIKNINLKPDMKSQLKYVYDAITLTRHTLNGRVPLIGFCGAPWTLMGYMIEGAGSKTYSSSKKWLYQNENLTNMLLDSITDCLIEYLICQVHAGAQLLQVFESNAGHLSPYLFTKYCTPRLRRIGKFFTYH